jgi:hypothetical protein
VASAPENRGPKGVRGRMAVSNGRSVAQVKSRD